MVGRRRLILALGAGALTYSSAPFAQPPPVAVPRIGYLSQGSPASRGAFLDAFRDGLRELGWVDGKNVVIEVHWALPHEFKQVASSLAKRNPAAIVGTCIPSTRAAKNATSTIPVIMSVNGDPVAAGLVASLAHPGGNVTGARTLFEELVPKWLELIIAAVPAARTVAVMVNPIAVDSDYWWARSEEAAQRMRIAVVRLDARDPGEMQRAIPGAVKRGVGALITMVDGAYLSNVKAIVALANAQRLPGLYGFREYAEAGGLMSYGVSYRDYFRGVARYVDRVLKGAKPAELPVQQPTNIELTVNRDAARTLGIVLPQALLVRADRVIG